MSQLFLSITMDLHCRKRNATSCSSKGEQKGSRRRITFIIKLKRQETRSPPKTMVAAAGTGMAVEEQEVQGVETEFIYQIRTL